MGCLCVYMCRMMHENGMRVRMECDVWSVMCDRKPVAERSELLA